MNYQMGAAMRGAQKKKPAVNRAVNNNNQNKKPDILQMDNDDIGEVYLYYKGEENNVILGWRMGRKKCKCECKKR